MNKNSEFSLNSEEKKFLLGVARDAIKAYVCNQPAPEFKVNSGALEKPCGVFVSLHKSGRLRGCIGNFRASRPLYKVVQEMSVASATGDPRFNPVTPDEVNELEIEISVLSPLCPIDNIDELELGKHGIYIQQGHKSGCFLPQVAVETGWTKEEFLTHCAQDKAGIAPDAWKKGATIYIFSAEVFSEKNF